MNVGIYKWRSSASQCTKYRRSYKLLTFVIAGGYIDFSLWLSFPPDAERGKTAAWAGDVPAPDRRTCSKDGVCVCVCGCRHKPVEQLFLLFFLLCSSAGREARFLHAEKSISIHPFHSIKVMKENNLSFRCVCVWGLTYFCCADMKLPSQP